MQARSRYKFSNGRVFIQIYEFGKRPAAQCRGISYPGATNCLGIESFIACSGAYPGLSFTVILLTALRPAKTETSLFTLLSVLGFRCNILSSRLIFSFTL